MPFLSRENSDIASLFASDIKHSFNADRASQSLLKRLGPGHGPQNDATSSGASATTDASASSDTSGEKALDSQMIDIIEEDKECVDCTFTQLNIQAALPLHDKTHIFPDGDLYLELEATNGRIFLTTVSSLSLKMVSPIWAKMLDTSSPLCSLEKDGYTHSDGVTKNLLALHEDDPASLYLILWLAHFRIDKVPKSGPSTFEQLRAIALVCDKYDIVKSIRQQIMSYPQGFGALALNNLMEDWFFICDAFRFGKQFGELAEALAQECFGYGPKPNEGSNGKELNRELIPDRVYDWITETRRRQLELIITKLRNFIAVLKNPPEEVDRETDGFMKDLKPYYWNIDDVKFKYFPECAKFALLKIWEQAESLGCIREILESTEQWEYGGSVNAFVLALRKFIPLYTAHNKESCPAEIDDECEEACMFEMILTNPFIMVPTGSTLKMAFPFPDELKPAAIEIADAQWDELF